MTDLLVLYDMSLFPNKSRDHQCSTIIFICSRASSFP